MPRSDLLLCLTIFGVDLDPDEINAVTGVVPAHDYRKGSRRHNGTVRTESGWGWHSSRSGWLIEDLVIEMLDVFGPHRDFLAVVGGPGRTVSLDVTGGVHADVVTTAEDADRRGYDVDDPRPFLDCDRIGFGFTAEAVAFLAGLGAELGTDIDVDLK